MRTRTSWTQTTIEIALAALGLHILILAVFRRYSLEGVGLPITAKNPSVALILCVLLLAVRIWLNRRSHRERPRGPGPLRARHDQAG